MSNLHMLLLIHLLSHEVTLSTFFAIIAPFHYSLQDNVNLLDQFGHHIETSQLI